ncbi:hypothetical protein Esi_0046_0078 [Ectocarpus siliculosus]|uniref:Uncharacterized protein n=1 Tax=Ectocarpus siliculosus TaxID=2880 RepID=D7G1W8_ECTSI|nr:hypothetical protein Esi_0046_0078 [Ectocarpus siliculosus]|eukprot:CBJ48694.1 hypothetical protein Esi_0046_0078 [Ectocarpus siliculosus]
MVVFLFIFGLVALAAGGAFLVRRSVLAEPEPSQRRLARPPSVLAERMAEVRRTQQSLSPEERRQSTRRHRVGVGTSGGGGGNSSGTKYGDGRGPRPLSRRSFLMSDDSTGGPPSPPREDSPLLGSRTERSPQSSSAGVLALAGSDSDDDEEQKGEKKNATGDWAGVDVENVVQVPGGSDLGDSDAGSRKTTVSAAPTTLSAADEALLGTFMEVLSEGLPIKIHRTSKRARKTTLWLKGADTLVWSSKRAIGSKQWHKQSLGGVTSVQAGKGGSDSLIIGSGESAPEDSCFSLCFPSVSMGFEAASELERDALVQGFAMLVEDIKAAADEQKYGDTEAAIFRDMASMGS